MSLEDAGKVTASELIEWIRQEQICAKDKELKEPDLITKAALNTYGQNLRFLEQDILRLAKGIVLDRN